MVHPNHCLRKWDSAQHKLRGHIRSDAARLIAREGPLVSPGVHQDQGQAAPAQVALAPVLSAPAPELTLSAHHLMCCNVLHIPRTHCTVSPGGLGSSLVVSGSHSRCSVTTGKLLSLSAPASSRSKGAKVVCTWLRGIMHGLPGYREACYSSSSFILLLKSVGTSLEWFRLRLPMQGEQV